MRLHAYRAAALGAAVGLQKHLVETFFDGSTAKAGRGAPRRRSGAGLGRRAGANRPPGEDRAGGQPVSLLIDLAVRSSIVLLAGLAGASLLARRSAALRHSVLASAILAAAAVAPLSLALPVWEVTVPAVLPAAVPAAAPAPAPAGVLPRANAPIEQRGSDRSFVVLVWAAGFLITAAILATGVLRLARIASRARRVHEDRWVSMTRTVAAGYGLRREIILLQTDAPNLLATWGVFRPRVLLPSHAPEWPEDRVHVVLCHELAHPASRLARADRRADSPDSSGSPADVGRMHCACG